MLFALLYLMLRRLLPLIAGSNDRGRDIELAVLRHQLMVLKRQVDSCVSAAATGCSWQRSAGCCGVLGGRRSWSARRPSFGGTGNC